MKGKRYAIDQPMYLVLNTNMYNAISYRVWNQDIPPATMPSIQTIICRNDHYIEKLTISNVNSTFSPLSKPHPLLVDANLLEEVDSTPALLATIVTSGFPEVVRVAECDRLPSNSVLNGLDSCSLLGRTGASGTVASGTVGRPSGLGNDTSLSRAEGFYDGELTSDKVTSSFSSNSRVEEGVDVASNDIDVGAEGGCVVLPDIEGLGRGALTSVSSAGELGLGAGNEGGQFTGGCVTVENTLITDDNEVNEVPLAPGCDFVNLGLGTAASGFVDKDTEDHLDTVGSASCTDVLEGRAVSAVNTDSGETSAGDG